MFNDKLQINICLGLGDRKKELEGAMRTALETTNVVHYFNCGDGIYMRRNLSYCTSVICVIYCMPIVPQ